MFHKCVRVSKRNERNEARATLVMWVESTDRLETYTTLFKKRGLDWMKLMSIICRPTE